jgi:hypothetical protein
VCQFAIETRTLIIADDDGVAVADGDGDGDGRVRASSSRSRSRSQSDRISACRIEDSFSFSSKQRELDESVPLVCCSR